MKFIYQNNEYKADDYACENIGFEVQSRYGKKLRLRT
ncbi:hypothetical protein C5S35_12350 [Candidatus Methanophagaceae archaeon]|nr:hypothetical protein C5S35_12350 [Methanophagales archaeon]